ncbi:MAG TPA: ABC transporter ATP-binding protein [Stellaceae bacterium]|nr:ABC transporter ATP-binding protein [Stellaceae bacterium]
MREESTSPGVAAPIIRFDDVGLALGGQAILENVSLTVRKGEFLCVIGPSGCGKTTLLRLLAGLVEPTAGRVLYDGERAAPGRRDIALMFQDYTKALLPWRTAYGNVSLALEAMGKTKSSRHDIIMTLLDSVGLAREADRYPSQLSGGMQQRVQIARCLAQEPAALLMDEPFGALDAITRQALQDDIQEIAARSNATVLFVTHDLEEAIYLGDRVVAMRPHPGRIATEFEIGLDRPRDRLRTPEEPEFLRLRRALFDVVKEGR